MSNEKSSHPNPWNFHNKDKALSSPDDLLRLVYYDLSEIAMGAPLGGPCFLEGNGEKVKIHDWCGGPSIWEKDGQRIAIPIWKRDLVKGTIQQLGIIDLKNRELRIYTKTFRVLDLQSFENNRVQGYDSPNNNTETVSFEIETEKVEKIINLSV